MFLKRIFSLILLIVLYFHTQVVNIEAQSTKDFDSNNKYMTRVAIYIRWKPNKPNEYWLTKRGYFVTLDKFTKIMSFSHPAKTYDNKNIIEAAIKEIINRSNNYLYKKRYTIALRIKNLNDDYHGKLQMMTYIIK